MKCTEVQEMLSAYYDHELPPEDFTVVESHLKECSGCQADLSQFEQLSSFVIGLENSFPSKSVWTNFEHELDCMQLNEPTEPAVRPELHPAQKSRFQRRRSIQFAVTIAATMMFGFLGWSLLHDDHYHSEMVAAIHQIAKEINSDGVADLLRKKFGGSEVTYQDAMTQVGYRPVASHGLPDGYMVASYQVLNMPCCKCTQTECLRPDNSRIFIFEHENEETGWFKHQTKRLCTCGGKECRITELGGQMAATWRKDNRHITLIGVRDEQELELLASAF